ncbi:MAG: hypothetical protein AAF363_04920 [Bacteroidota bacterium]
MSKFDDLKNLATASKFDDLKKTAVHLYSGFESFAIDSYQSLGAFFGFF